MTVPDPQVQLRLEFTTPTRPQQLLLTLSGIQVMAVPRDDDTDLAVAYLTAAGATVQLDEIRGPLFPVRELPRLLRLPGQVDVTATHPVDVLWELVKTPPVGDAPVTVTIEDRETLNLSWPAHGDVEFNEAFPLSAAAALMALETPLVAQPDAWDAFIQATSLPVVLARARVNLDGFVELTSPVPHQLEVAPIPALFRVDDTHFGLPLAYADRLDGLPGVVWEHRPPSYDRAPRQVPDLPFELSPHGLEDLRGLVAGLASTRGQAVVWDHGLGRRIFCLAAVEMLQAFPLLVVTSPSSMWAWLRHLELVGRSATLSHDRGDVHILTYRDLAARPRLASPASVIFDDLDVVQRQTPELLKSLHRLDGLVDAYRIAASVSFPTDLDDIVGYMSVLRPVEFRSDVPALLRYPVNAEQRLTEHVECYRSRRVAGSTPQPRFRRSSTEVLEAPQSTLDALEAARRDHRSAPHLLAELLGIVSAGPSHAIGPKVVRAAEILSDARRADRRAAVVTRHDQTARVLAGLLRPLKPEVVRSATPSGEVAIIHAEKSLPDLRSYAVVVFVDYPVNLGMIDDAVGRASDPSGPEEVIMLHLAGTIDDRLALLSALRQERASVSDPNEPLNDADISYLLR
jgi:hypothetical protein